MNYQVDRQLGNLAYEIGNTTLNMARVQRTSSEAGSMGGLMWFLQQETGNVLDASSASISAALINNVMEIAAQNGHRRSRPGQVVEVM